MIGRLEQGTGRTMADADLDAAIRESDAARRAVRRLLALRRGPAPRLGGAEALMLVGAWYFMDRSDYASLASQAHAEVSRRAPLQGPRLMICGAPCDHVRLHAAIESHGAVVVAEDDWWGSRSVGRDVRTGSNGVERVFRKYYEDAPGPRVFPQSRADGWFVRESLRGIDGVVHYLPREDDVHGWDYPRRRGFLDAHGIPSLAIHEDAAGAFVSADVHGTIQAFVDRIAHARVTA
jgi:benzoyl-CoA reductase/2-hydroxyglutaryl-CoA dehydratase subunit BcrC/BadD/HgdB